MALNIREYETPAALIKFIDQVKDVDAPWGAAIIKRSYLRSMTKEALILSIKSTMEGAEEAHFLFFENTAIYIVWHGKQKAVYLKLHHIISTALMRQELNVNPSKIITYHDLRSQSEEIKNSLTALVSDRPTFVNPGLFRDEAETENISFVNDEATALKASSEEVQLFRHAQKQNAQQKQLRLMVVEDEIFSQKLLCEILRGIRLHNYHESPIIDVTQSLQEAWKSYLKKAPHIIFIDLNLADGSGHTLARAIKELDPRSRIVIITSNNYLEEIEVARQNNIDFFIAKPYNKKQILDCVSSYFNLNKIQTSGML